MSLHAKNLFVNDVGAIPTKHMAMKMVFKAPRGILPVDTEEQAESMGLTLDDQDSQESVVETHSHLFPKPAVKSPVSTAGVSLPLLRSINFIISSRLNLR